MIADFVLMCYNEENSPERACLYMTLSAKPSPDYLRYPTFAPLPRSVARCSGCGGSAFEFLLPQWKPVCKRCGKELELPAAPQKPLTAPPKPSIQILGEDDYTLVIRSDGTTGAFGHEYSNRNSSWGHPWSEVPCRFDVQRWSDVTAIAAGKRHIIGLRKGGGVLVDGDNSDGQCSLRDWSGITAIAAGSSHTVGLRKDGTVRAVGDNSFGRCDIRDWSGIIAIAAGSSHTVGLRKDGTVRAVGDNSFSQCNVRGWSGITAIAAGHASTVGLRKDGTVITAGYNKDGQCNVQNWSDVSVIAAGSWHTVGLQKGGTVLAAGDNSCGQCNVQGWFGVAAVWAGAYFTAAMTVDGTLLCTDQKILERIRKALA